MIGRKVKATKFDAMEKYDRSYGVALMNSGVAQKASPLLGQFPGFAKKEGACSKPEHGLYKGSIGHNCFTILERSNPSTWLIIGVSSCVCDEDRRHFSPRLPFSGCAELFWSPP